MRKITPCLWFDNQAEEAAKFYTSIFNNSKIGTITHYGDSSSKASGRPSGSIMTVTFELDGNEYLALNGGPHFKFSEAISLMVYCKSQAEIDEYWAKLSEGGEEGPCGWLKDKFGLSWQVVPTAMDEMMKDKNPARSERVMNALLQMKKLDLKALQSVYDQK